MTGDAGIAAPIAPARARYDLVILDFDGTLADSARWFAGVINEVARRYRFRQTTRDELETLRGEGVPGILRALDVARCNVPLIARHMRKLVARDIEQIALFPGARRLLNALADAGVGLAIVSSNAEANVRHVLGPETAARIDRFACGASLHGKVAKFRAMLGQAGVAPARAIAIGDEVRDIEAATSVGIASGAVDWGYATRAALAAHGPTIIFDDMAAIAPFVLGETR